MALDRAAYYYALSVRVAGSMGFAVVDRMADYFLLCGRAIDRFVLQTCPVLQIRVSHRPVQFCLFHCLTT